MSDGTLTNYPNGISSFGMPVVGGGGIMTTGNVFFVDSGNTARGDVSGKGKDPLTPFATLGFAAGRPTANNGDIIFVMPGHAEDISSATSIVLAIAGVRVIGLGVGRTRPVFTYTATAGSLEMNAANCSFENCVFLASESVVVVGINIDAADVSIIDCEFDFDETGDDFITAIDIDAVDRASVIGCRFIAENGTAGMAEAIRMDTANEAIIRNNSFTGDFTDGCIVMEGAASNSVDISGNRMWNGHANGRYIVNSVASDGLFDGNTQGFEDAQAHAQSLLSSLGGAGALNWQIAKHVSSVFDGGTTNSHGDLAGTNDPYTIFTVTGDIIVKAIWGICNTNLTGTNATISVGVAGNTAVLIALETATEIDDGNVYVSATQAIGAAAIANTGMFVINDGADIIEEPLTANVEAGQLDYYCIWAPAEDGASLISAEAVV